MNYTDGMRSLAQAQREAEAREMRAEADAYEAQEAYDRVSKEADMARRSLRHALNDWRPASLLDVMSVIMELDGWRGCPIGDEQAATDGSSLVMLHLDRRMPFAVDDVAPLDPEKPLPMLASADGIALRTVSVEAIASRLREPNIVDPREPHRPFDVLIDDTPFDGRRVRDWTVRLARAVGDPNVLVGIVPVNGAACLYVSGSGWRSFTMPLSSLRADSDTLVREFPR